MAKAAGKNKKYLSYILRFGIAALALYFAFRGEDLTQVKGVLLGLNLWICIAAFSLFILAQFIFAFRWNLLMRVQAIKIGYWPALRLHFLGLFYNNCLPSAVGGDLLRIWYVTKHTDKKLEAGLSVFVDRAIGLGGMFIMAFFCYWFIPTDTGQSRFAFPYKINLWEKLAHYSWILAGIIAVFVLVCGVILINEKGRTLLCRALVIVARHASTILKEAKQAFRIYCRKWWAVLCALLLTFTLQGLCITAMWLIGREIGVTAHPKYYFIFFPISWLLGTLPISVGGAGIMELWLKDIFIRVCGVAGKHALVLAFAQRFLWLFGSLPGVVIHLAGAHLPGKSEPDQTGPKAAKQFFVDSDEPVD